MSERRPEQMRTGLTSDRTEEQLRAEIEELRRRLDEHGGPRRKGHKRPSAATLWTLGILAAAIIVVAFFAGYLPQSSRQAALVSEARNESAALPIVNVTPVERSSGNSELVLYGDIQAVTEAPVLARASGYIKTRYVDIGDRVKEGQLLAEIDAPELNEQVRQGKPPWNRRRPDWNRPTPTCSRE